MSKSDFHLFIQYIKNPAYRTTSGISPFDAIKGLLPIYLKSFLLLFPLAGISIFTAKFLNLEHMSTNLPLQQKIIGAIVLAPILEELISRGFLNLRPQWILLSILTYPTYLAYGKGKEFIEPDWLLLPILITILLSIVWLLSKPKRFWIRIQSIGKRHFRILFYLSTISFGFFHVINFSPCNGYTLLFTPLLVLPQLYLGLVLGYTRVNFGLGYSIFFHLGWNTILLLPEIIHFLAN